MIYRATYYILAQKEMNVIEPPGHYVDKCYTIEAGALFTVVKENIQIRYKRKTHLFCSILTHDGTLCYAWNHDMEGNYEKL